MQMIKSILKEIIIILLLLLAIILLLGVLFYDYIPTNKTVPSVAEYTTSEAIKAELTEQMATEEEAILVTYEITENDLTNYEKKGDYSKGKANPFSTYQKVVTENNNTNANTPGNTDEGSSTGGTGNTNTGTFYPSTGTK